MPEIPTVQGTLALDLAPRLEPPPVPDRLSPAVHDHDGRHAGHDHGGGSGGSHGGGDVVPIDRQQRRALEAWSWRYAQAVVEVVAGDRPVSQLLRWTTPAVYADLARRAHLVARAGGHVAGQGRRHRTAVRAQVLGVRTSFVGRDAAETSVHVRHGARSRAIAARFELADGRWQCAALEFA